MRAFHSPPPTTTKPRLDWRDGLEFFSGPKNPNETTTKRDRAEIKYPNMTGLNMQTTCKFVTYWQRRSGRRRWLLENIIPRRIRHRKLQNRVWLRLAAVPEGKGFYTLYTGLADSERPWRNIYIEEEQTHECYILLVDRRRWKGDRDRERQNEPWIPRGLSEWQGHWILGTWFPFNVLLGDPQQHNIASPNVLLNTILAFPGKWSSNIKDKCCWYRGVEVEE